MTVQESYEWFTRHFVHWDEVCRKRYSNPSKWDIFWLEKMDLIKVYAAIKYLPEGVKKARVEWDEMNKKRFFSLPQSRIALCVGLDREREWNIMTLGAGIPPKDDYERIILLQEPKAKEGFLANAPSVTVPDEKAEEYRTDRVPWSKYGLMPQGMAVEETALVRASGKREYYYQDIKRNGYKYHSKMHACSGLCNGCICFHCKNDRPECCCKIHTTREDEEFPEKQCTDSTCPWFEPEPISIEHLTLNVVTVYRGKLEFYAEHTSRLLLHVPNYRIEKQFLTYGPVRLDKLKSVIPEPLKETELSMFCPYDFAQSIARQKYPDKIFHFFGPFHLARWCVVETDKNKPIAQHPFIVGGKKFKYNQDDYYNPIEGLYTFKDKLIPQDFIWCDMVRAKDSGKTEEELRQLPMVW